MSSDNPERYSRGKVVCVGDLLVDVWWYADTSARNPEHAAVALVSDPGSRKIKPGGIGIVADSLSRANFAVHLFSITDDKPDTLTMLAKLQQRVIYPYWPIAGFNTPVKTRYINANGHIIVRHDSEIENKAVGGPGWPVFKEALTGANCVVVSDYQKNCIPAELQSELVFAASAARVPIYVDAKPDKLQQYAGASMFKLNMPEFLAFVRTIGGAHSVVSGMSAVARKLRTPLLVVTDGGDGVYYCHNYQTPEFMPTPKKYSAGNCVGAGDTFFAGLILGLSELGKYSTTELTAVDLFGLMRVALIAAGQRIRANGRHAFNAIKIMTEVRRKNLPVRRIMSPADIIKFAETQRAAGKRVVFTNGCFDLLHSGHIELLTAAKQAGDLLLVGVDSDANVRRLKGEDRPIHNEQVRAGNVAALDVVDAVCVFTDQADNAALESLIAAIKPTALVKGMDYVNKQIVGADIVTKQDPPGYVTLVPIVPDSSTTLFVNKIKGL